ncbi:hypothetical protein [Streptomyces lydicus]|uniref:hypothetical protein n=1 Tax=Streptomyces lydicus TaxID=47763 RepID=UPI0037AE32E8
MGMQGRGLFNVAASRDGELYVAAADVTAMLRKLALEWVAEAQAHGFAWEDDDGRRDLDVATVRALAARVTAQADDMDLQLILMSENIRPPQSE